MKCRLAFQTSEAELSFARGSTVASATRPLAENRGAASGGEQDGEVLFHPNIDGR